MPTYSYQCCRCGASMSLRRLFSEMDEPAECLMCGQEMKRRFVPNGNIHVPSWFLTSWSDVHDVSEKELAKQDGLEKSQRAFSQAGFGS